MNTAPVRERGGCLSIYILVAILGSILGLLSVSGLQAVNEQLRASGLEVAAIPSWYVPAQVALIVITLVAIYGIVSWKKWGVYLLVVQWLLSLGVSIAAGQPLTTSLVVLAIEAVLLVIVLRNKWPLFE